MKTNLLAALLLMMAVGALGQGTIIFYNRATSGSPAPVVAPIFGIDPANIGLKSGNPVATWNGTAGPTPAPIGTQVYGGAPLAGSGFTAAIWGINASLPDSALADPALLPLATATFRVNTAPDKSFEGFWNASVVAVPGVAGGSIDRAKFMVRAWNNRGGILTSWQQVLADTTVERGESLIFVVDAPLGLSPSIAAPNLVGLQSFQLYPTPEPSVIALGLLAAGLLLLRRHRN